MVEAVAQQLMVEAAAHRVMVEAVEPSRPAARVARVAAEVLMR